ncbi:hypothetical protein GT360_20350 [Vibrio astriarenae]|uniref:Uncharacterized protein n=1 Tax=Vibrio astriarenae TaxID=1481923 RepID=A0A7Z2T7T9_9VIBR|nr:hypothetical protein [Vibrio astriarenae]QIA65860.1 hypothetical protein GT360_20350 [Vibrio astriarenae]
MRKAVLAGVILGVLSGCGGSDGDGGNDQGDFRNPMPTKQSVTKVFSLLGENEYSNLYQDVDLPHEAGSDLALKNNRWFCNAFACAVDNNTPPMDGMIRRHDIDQNLIPVYVNNANGLPEFEVHKNIYDGIKLIEDAVGRKVFDLSDADGEIPVVQIEILHDDGSMVWSHEVDYSSLPTEGGFIFEFNYEQAGHTGLCGAAGKGPWDSSGSTIIAADSTVVNLGWQWIRIASEDATCTHSPELVAHELTHALGFRYHFAGFGGEDRPSDPRPVYGSHVFGHQAKEVLKQLFAHDIGSDVNNMNIPNY